MTKEFLKEKDIAIENVWVCHDTKRNVRTVDIEQLLEDYYKWKVKKLNIPDVSGQLPKCVDCGERKASVVNRGLFNGMQCYECKKVQDIEDEECR